MSYTNYKRGSEWRKWDLHIHTPETKKNDLFEGSTIEEKWEKYAKTINESTEDIAVVGITDYFSIDNYFKFKELIRKGTITKKFDLVIPNIEIRVTPVTGSATPINLHCLFNPEIEAHIETRFLSKLNFSYSGSSYSAKKEELIRLGKSLPGKSGIGDDEAYKEGINNYVISIDTVREIFEKDINLRENTIIVVSNKSTDGASGIRNHEEFFISPTQSQLDATRWSIYQFSDAIFSSSEKDYLYFTAQGPDNKKSLIEKCGNLMPCYHGCDAHENSKIFKPDLNRFCWIKADPTFQGLKQTVYECEDRVKIQTLKPDIKNDRFIIDKLQFVDSGNLFGNQTILLNENLNAIIGGKSSGKSLLLYSTAKSIDPEQVDRTSRRLGFEGYNFGTSKYDFKVIWKNGDEDLLSNNVLVSKNHKITYIPQLYINYLVEKNNKEELNSLIKNILIQDSTFKTFFDCKTEEIKTQTTEIDRLVNEYIKTRNELLVLQQKKKDLGSSKNIKDGYEKLEGEITKGQKLLNLTPEEIAKYTLLISQKSVLENDIRKLNIEEIALNKVLTEVQNAKFNLLGKHNNQGLIELKGQIERILDELGEVPQSIIDIKNKIEDDYNTLISNLRQGLSKLEIGAKRAKQNSDIQSINVQLQPYIQKLSGQKELQKLGEQLQSEKLKFQNAIENEKQFDKLFDEYGKIRIQISFLLKNRNSLYNEIEIEINSSRKIIGKDILLNSKVLYKISKFALHEQVNKASINNDHFYKKFIIQDEFVDYNLVSDFFSEPLRPLEDKLYYAENSYIPLKTKISFEDVLRGLVKDNLEIDYTVTYRGDNLLNMSPGKKGTVLLILFLQISSSEFPILIDQPEDNLDNRTIYELLCNMIKLKKKERQIIIVSHNANLVVATDTENIIVANQRGQDEELEDEGTGPAHYQFEYVNGSLECSFEKIPGILSILESQGIREHVCDILEGGDEAFKQRERKYSIK